MNRLPDTRGMKNEVVVARSHRNFYDHAVRAAGVSLVEAGISDRYSGAGVRDTEAWEIAAEITEIPQPCSTSPARTRGPALADVVAAAHAQGVPVLVDAAAQLPPAANLRQFIAEGADLVCFSGGKAIGGTAGIGDPVQAEGSVMAAALQHLDQDITGNYRTAAGALRQVAPPRLAATPGLAGRAKVGRGDYCRLAGGA
ncbi:MAG: hypothetical protein IPO58_25275 [Betaproteobacteria bacterium]|nr:hypothetical protein [Betaproteobacteria bacterium]